MDGTAAALFAAGVAARSKGKVLWCLTRPDLFPCDRTAGLHHDRVIFREGDKEEDVLASIGRRAVLRRNGCSRGRTGAPAEDGISHRQYLEAFC